MAIINRTEYSTCTCTCTVQYVQCVSSTLKYPQERIQTTEGPGPCENKCIDK
jgi:hypothetical protein